MKVMVVSHPSVLAVNQQPFAALSDLFGWSVDIVAPSTWHGEFGDYQLVRSSHHRGRLVGLPVVGSGNVALHVYPRGFSGLLSRLDPDAVFVHHEPYALATLQVVRAVRARWERRRTLGIYSAQNNYKERNALFARFERHVLRSVDFAAPVSDEVFDVLRRKGFTGRGGVLPLAVAADEHPRVATKAADQHRVFTVGFVGRLVPEKGLEDLVEAMARLHERRLCRLVVVGEGPSRAAAERRCREAGLASHFVGVAAHDVMSTVYESFDVLAVPSRSTRDWREQFGRVVVEALAAGVPVVTSDSGELPHLVTRSGGGWVVPECDPGALAAALADVADQPEERRRRAVKGRSFVAQKSSNAAYATALAALIAPLGNQ